MTYYDLSAKEVASVVQADTRNGLTQAEAARRLTAFGENKLDEKKKKPLRPRQRPPRLLYRSRNRHPKHRPDLNPKRLQKNRAAK